MFCSLTLTQFCNNIQFESNIFKYVLLTYKFVFFLEASGKLFIYKKNKYGPRQNPCGTPQLLISSSDKMFEIFEYCFLLVK